ncbi:DUF5069 domain-containing protein [Coraliomargarita sp. W4R72]
MNSNEKVKLLAKDLSQEVPRGARSTLGGYVIAARTLDKCRAVLAGTEDEYHYDCPLDNFFFGFAEITSDDFKAYVATGATDAEVAEWITQNAKKRERAEIVQWNNDLRYKRICDLPTELQVYMEDYIPENLPKHRPVYVLFDVYDLEEGRM